MKKELVLRDKFNEDYIPKITEPRFCYKFVNGSKSSLNEQTVSLMNKDDSFFKKLVVDNNFNFLFDLVQNLLNPVEILVDPKSQTRSIEDRILTL